jgi:prevent-host-death family protein
MIQVNIARAKATLSELVARAEAGEEVVIARDGRPVVVLVPTAPRQDQGPRPLGLWEHLLKDLPQDAFLGPDADVTAWLKVWEDEPIGRGP